MKYVVPVAKTANCPHDLEHMEQWEISVDEFGVVDTICPEHGPLIHFDSKEFDNEAEAKAWVAARRGWPLAKSGPQPGEAACCESCRIVAEAVYKLALVLEYPVTAARIRALLDDDAINTETINQ